MMHGLLQTVTPDTTFEGDCMRDMTHDERVAFLTSEWGLLPAEAERVAERYDHDTKENHE